MLDSAPENLIPGNDPATMGRLDETIKCVHSSQNFVSGNRYQILRSIAEGTSGVVLCAFDQVLERQVAIKIPKHTGISNASSIAFLNEARLTTVNVGFRQNRLY